MQQEFQKGWLFNMFIWTHPHPMWLIQKKSSQKMSFFGQRYDKCVIN